MWSGSTCVTCDHQSCDSFHVESAPHCPAPHVVGTLEVTEAALVRDILYVFQGIDGKNIKMSNAENCYKVEAKVCTRTAAASAGESRPGAGQTKQVAQPDLTSCPGCLWLM